MPKKLTIEQFIEKAKKVHGDKYDYSKTNYVDSHTKVCIICPEHGEFWQFPGNHLKYGCDKCSESHLENEIANCLSNNGILFEQEKTFDWLKYENNMYLDFYLPDYNIAIECQGEQHFKPVGFGCKDETKIQEMFNKVKKRDFVKENLCLSHNIKLFYYSKKNGLIQNTDELIKKIKMGII